MSVNWKEEIEARKDDLLKDLFTLLSIPSERDDSKATADAPVGPGPKAALLKMLEIGERDGFVTKNVENIAGHIEFGEGNETLGIFGHMDVVPAGDGWSSDPYTPEIRDGKVYARGASDDKGPSVAAYYAMKLIKELNLPISKKIRFIVGSDEESGWKDMERYFANEEKPDFGFAPDAEFPIINGEKGNVTVKVLPEGTNGKDYILKSFHAGLRENMVPAIAHATLVVKDEETAVKVETAFMSFVESYSENGTVKRDGNTLTFEVSGKASHGASPQNGINAGTALGRFLNTLPLEGGAKKFVGACEAADGDHYGKAMGVAIHDDLMGDLTMNAGILNFEDGKEDNLITLNFRFPQGTNGEVIAAGIQKALGKETVVKKADREEKPHYVPVTDPLVKTLLDVYEEHTGNESYEQVIGGGTFGRLLERGVAFGAQFPGYQDTMHQPDEFMSVEDILRSAAIYADAIYRLVK